MAIPGPYASDKLNLALAAAQRREARMAAADAAELAAREARRTARAGKLRTAFRRVYSTEIESVLQITYVADENGAAALFTVEGAQFRLERERGSSLAVDADDPTDDSRVWALSLPQRPSIGRVALAKGIDPADTADIFLANVFNLYGLYLEREGQ